MASGCRNRREKLCFIFWCRAIWLCGARSLCGLIPTRLTTRSPANVLNNTPNFPLIISFNRRSSCEAFHNAPKAQNEHKERRRGEVQTKNISSVRPGRKEDSDQKDFFDLCEKNVWQCGKMMVPLQHETKKASGSLAQLNRASDYGSEGYRFESYRSHF